MDAEVAEYWGSALRRHHQYSYLGHASDSSQAEPVKSSELQDVHLSVAGPHGHQQALARAALAALVVVAFELAWVGFGPSGSHSAALAVDSDEIAHSSGLDSPFASASASVDFAVSAVAAASSDWFAFS